MISPMSILSLASSVDILRLVILLQLGLGLGLAYYIATIANLAHTKPGVDELSAAPASNSNLTTSAAAAAEYVEGGGMKDVDVDDRSTRGIFHPSFGSNRVHSLIIRSSEEIEDEYSTTRTDSVIYSPRPHPSPSSFKSGNSRESSEIKRQRYPAFRMPASPPQPVAPHWSRLVSPPSLVSPSSLLSSNGSEETDTESPLSSFSPVHDDKWHSAIFEDSAATVLTRIQEHEAATIAQLNGDGCFGSGLGMPAVSSMQSVWEDAIKLIVPPNSPMVEGIDVGCVEQILEPSPHIDLDELGLHFIKRPTIPALATTTIPIAPRPTASKIQRVHRRLLRPFILRRVKASARKHAMHPAQTQTQTHCHCQSQSRLQPSSSSLENKPPSSEKTSVGVRSGKTLRHMFRLGANVA